MAEMAGFLDQWGMALILAQGALYFVFMSLAAYTLQAISDKTDAAPSWMSWVPFVQMHPFIRACGTTWTAILGWVVCMVAVIVLSAIASSSGAGGIGFLLGFGLVIGSLVYFCRLMWRLAENRDLSGWVGIACLIPLLGLLFYLYIAFHDGFVPPSLVGLGVALLLSIVSAFSFSQDLGEMQQMMQQTAQAGPNGPETPEEALALFGSITAAMEQTAQARPNGPQTPEEARALFDSITAQIERGRPAGLPPQSTGMPSRRPASAPAPAPAPARESGSGAASGLLARLSDWMGVEESPPGYPAELSIPERAECEPGTRAAGAAPPRGREMWCERESTGQRHGWYLSWYRDGTLRRAGRFADGQKQGTWTRFWETGERQAAVHFEDDHEHGLLVIWRPDGERDRMIRYERGEPGPL